MDNGSTGRSERKETLDILVRIESKRRTGSSYSLDMSISNVVLREVTEWGSKVMRDCEIERDEAYERKVTLPRSSNSPPFATGFRESAALILAGTHGTGV